MLVALVVVVAITTTWLAGGPPQPPVADFFGFFTIQANLIGAAVAAIGAVRSWRGALPTRWWSVVRWSAATCLVGVVYWLLPAVVVYPLVWLVVVLVRGATDGWAPYPFLSPAQGYPVVAGWAALVAGVFAAAAALLRLLRARRSSARPDPDLV